MEKTIALVIAHEGFQPIEYGVPKKILEKKGYTVITVSNKAGKAQTEQGVQVGVDMIIDDVDIDAIDGLFFVGGPGALQHLDTPESEELIIKMNETGKPLGAICISTRILAKAGVLTGKRAAGWDGDNKLANIFDEHGVIYIKEPCVVDDTIVTAVDPSAAHEFAENIVTLFENQQYDQL